MTTIADQQQTGLELSRLQESEQQAWQSYTKSLHDLAGRAYDEAEGRSWARLQRKLSQIENRRSELCGGRTGRTR